MNIELQQRITYFSCLFHSLQSTNSINEKKYYLQGMPEEYKSDWLCIIETIDGRHPIGYTYDRYRQYINPSYAKYKDFRTVREVIEYLREPFEEHDISDSNVLLHVQNTYYLHEFIGPIIDRTLRLGIGKSVMENRVYAPMLAKKFDPNKIPRSDKYFVTEKLDGNRCIARFDGLNWTFTSRNGKPMYVDFDMSGLPTYYVYDGEVMTRKQTEQSDARSNGYYDTDIAASTAEFSVASGLINSHSYNKDLVYNIFDIIDLVTPYEERRNELDMLMPLSSDVRILPVLATYDYEIDSTIMNHLAFITSTGGEGLMINCGDRVYVDKRTDGLLKVKNAYTVDLEVTDIISGQGKYDGLVGALHCVGTADGTFISCDVGTGLTDDMRRAWTDGSIVGSIVEIEYFSLSYIKGRESASLRFPRFKRVRDDKSTISLD